MRSRKTSNRCFWALNFRGSDTPNFGHVFSNCTHFRTCGRFWTSSSFPWARRAADEKWRSTEDRNRIAVDLSPPTTTSSKASNIWSILSAINGTLLPERYIRVFAIANPSVCRLSVCLSVTLVHHRLLRKLKLTAKFLHRCLAWPSWRSSLWNPSVGSVKHMRGFPSSMAQKSR